MDKNQRLSSIARVLTLPFTDLLFWQEDPLKEKLLCYQSLLENRGIRSEGKKKYRKLEDFLIEHMASLTYTERLDDILQLFNLFYPDSEMGHYLSQGTPLTLDQYYMKRIFDISRSFVTLRDGSIAIRTWDNPNKEELFEAYSGLNKVELWNALTRIMTPDIFIAAYYVNAHLEQPENLTNVPPNIKLNDTPLMKVLEKGIAETHLHLNAGLSYLSVWEIVTDFLPLDLHSTTVQAVYRDSPYVALAGVLRFLMADFISQKDHRDIVAFYKETDGLGRVPPGDNWFFRTLADICLPSEEQHAQAFASQWFTELSERRIERIGIIRAAYGIPRDKGDLDLLAKSIYRGQSPLNTSWEILFLFEALKYISHHPLKSQFIHVFLQYLRLKNAYFSDKMQIGHLRGLRNFQKYFDQAADAPYRDFLGQSLEKEAVYLSIFKDQCKCVHLRKLEVKISPRFDRLSYVSWGDDRREINELKRSIASQLVALFKAYLHYYSDMEAQYLSGYGDTLQGGAGREMSDILQEKRYVSFPSIGVVYHFIKSDDPDNWVGDVCWLSPEAEAANGSNYIPFIRRRNMLFTDALTELFRDVRYLSEYVVGIDAASDELGSEPWVLAPVFMHARRKGNTYPTHLETRAYIQNLGFTYHVGEDYRHLLSGMRYIDEVLTHFGYKSGDRLGHALALQVSACQWATTNEVVVLPIMEYLENLVWLWQITNQHPEISGGVSLELEHKIMETADQIFSNVLGLSPYVLWKAYQQKFRPLDQDKAAQLKAYYLGDPSPLFSPEEADGISDSKRSFCRLYRHGNCQNCEENSSAICKTKTCLGIDHIWDVDKLMMTYYCPVYGQHFKKPVFVKTTMEEVAVLDQVQTYLKEKIQRDGIYVETNPTSNAIIGDVSGLLEHPLLSLHNDSLNPNADSHVLLTINSDDPLVFNTSVEQEICNMYHLLVKRGYSRTTILSWIDRVRQFGLDSSFIRQIKKPSTQKKELKEMVELLEKIDVWSFRNGT